MTGPPAAAFPGGGSREPAAGRGLSLWLLPAATAAAPLAARIGALAARLDGPVFTPHLTLLSGLTLDEDDARRRAAALAGRLEPLPLPVEDTGGDDFYFRALYLRMTLTPELAAARTAAARAFSMDPAGFLPHLSLAYAWLDEATRQDELTRPGDRATPEASTIPFDRLELHRTLGPVDHWTTLGCWPLTGP